MGRLRDKHREQQGKALRVPPKQADIQPPDRAGDIAAAPSAPQAPQAAPAAQDIGNAPTQPPPATVASPAAHAAPSAVSAPASESIGDFLQRLSPEAFRIFARDECQRHGVKTLDQAAKRPELKAVVMEVIRRGEADQIFFIQSSVPPGAPAAAPAAAQAPELDGPKRSRPPPPPPRPSKPPPALLVGTDGSPVSGYEETVAHETGAKMPSARPPPTEKPLPPPPTRKPSVKMPPAPPQRAKTTMRPPKPRVEFYSELGTAFRTLVDEMDRDVHDNTVDGTDKRLENAQRLFHAGGELMRSKTRELMQSSRPEDIRKAQASAAQKSALLATGGTATLEQLEAMILDIDTFNRALGRLEETIRFLTAAAAEEKELRKIQQRNGHAPNGSAGAQAKAGAPAAAAVLSPVEEAELASPPSKQPPAPAAAAKKGLVSRFLANYWMPTTLGIAAFGGAMLYNDKFRALARGIQYVLGSLERFTHRPAPAIPVTWVEGVFAGAMAALIITTEIVRRVVARRRAAKDFAAAQLSKSDGEKSRYITEALKKLVSDYTHLESAQRKLRTLGSAITDALRADDTLFEYVFDLRRAPIFRYILADAKIPDKLHGPVFDELLSTVERERIQGILGREFADIAGSDSARRAKFGSLYSSDSVFMKICDSLFATNIGGDYVDGGRAERVFKPVKNHRKEVVGEELLAGLRSDYKALKESGQ